MQTPDFTVAERPMADIESRMGLDPIHVLNGQRQAFVARVADYRAKYGPGGTFDAHRKAMLSQIKMQIRAEAVRFQSSRKMTEAQLDEEAHADPRYIDVITTATRERAEYAVLEAKIEALDAIVNRGQAVARYLAMETRL